MVWARRDGRSGWHGAVRRGRPSTLSDCLIIHFLILERTSKASLSARVGPSEHCIKTGARRAGAAWGRDLWFHLYFGTRPTDGTTVARPKPRQRCVEGMKRDPRPSRSNLPPRSAHHGLYSELKSTHYCHCKSTKHVWESTKHAWVKSNEAMMEVPTPDHSARSASPAAMMAAASIAAVSRTLDPVS